jgi:hypothetical protein
MAVNGLPNAKDSVMVPDLKATKVPPMISKNIELFIGVFSTSENFDRRMAICTTSMQYPLIHNGTIVVRFFIGMVSFFHQILLLLVHFNGPLQGHLLHIASCLVLFWHEEGHLLHFPTPHCVWKNMCVYERD